MQEMIIFGLANEIGTPEVRIPKVRLKIAAKGKESLNRFSELIIDLIEANRNIYQSRQKKV